jgi:UDP-glucose 4-epimerase
MLGSKEDSRDFVYVKDLCRAFELAIKKKPVGETINFGTGKETTIYSLAQTIAKILGKEMKFNYSDKIEIGKLTRMCANVSKAKKLLDWEAKFSLEEGVTEVAKNLGLEKNG